jgi:hypothetical protein
MKLRPIPGKCRYAVAIREGSDLWLTLWVRRSPKPEFFVMQPRSDRGWDPHVSYHFNGKLHFKSHGRVVLKKERQPLSDTFRGTVHLGGHGGHGKSIGAICDRKAFDGVVEVESDVLDPRHGQVVVDLVEPGCKPMPWPFVLVRRKTFKHRKPWVVIRIGRDINDPLPAFSWRLSLFFVKVFVARLTGRLAPRRISRLERIVRRQISVSHQQRTCLISVKHQCAIDNPRRPLALISPFQADGTICPPHTSPEHLL